MLAETREEQLRLFPSVRRFFDELLGDKNRRAQIIMYDYYMAGQVLKMLKDSENYFVMRLMRSMENFFGLNRIGYFVPRDKGGNEFELSLSIGESYFEQGDLYPFDLARLTFGKRTFVYDPKNLDPRRYDSLFIVRNHFGRIIRILAADCTTLERELSSDEIFQLEVVAEFFNEFISTKVINDESVNLDSLTGIYLRRFITEAPPEFFENLTCMGMIDLDHFKHLNDKYGHHVGDQALQMTVDLIKRSLREGDIARWGGEEFWVGLRNISLADARNRFEEINLRLSKMRIPGVDREVTFSMGLIQYDNKRSLDENVQTADKLLYKAKESRNLVLAE